LPVIDGTLPRYPNELGISNEDMKNALVNAGKIQEFIIKIFDGAIQVASKLCKKSIWD
jgi:hypothetical protein